ncbi:hypothetical protein BCCGELA001_09695 [Bradyrhizobium sp. CCGE-LA001]|nr:hypothetical protein BCCGELA001_09695 [Bradyrhizobium sp. CCGE-LA001]
MNAKVDLDIGKRQHNAIAKFAKAEYSTAVRVRSEPNAPSIVNNDMIWKRVRMNKSAFRRLPPR